MDSKKSPGGAIPSTSTSEPPPPPYEPKDAKFATLSLHQTDRIRLLQFSPEDVEKIRLLTESAWPDGIQEVRDYGDSFELKLKGKPWTGSKNDRPKQLLRMLFQGLHDMGWVFDAGFSIAKKPDAKDTLLFRKHDGILLEREWFVISFDKFKILSIHNGPHDVNQKLMQAFAEWSETTESFNHENRVEIRLKNSYWMSHGENTMILRKMMLRMAETLDAFHFKIHASVRTVGQLYTTAEQEADVIVCSREKSSVDNGN